MYSRPVFHLPFIQLKKEKDSGEPCKLKFSLSNLKEKKRISTEMEPIISGQ